MAEVSKQDIEDAKSGFEAGQLDLPKYLAGNPDILVDFEDIRGDIRAKIEEALPEHKLLFQRALDKAGKDLADSGLDENRAAERAHVAAFKLVYGKFVIKARPEAMSAPDSPFMTKLNEVLDENADRGDPAISAAMYRLSTLKDEEAAEANRREILERNEMLVELGKAVKGPILNKSWAVIEDFERFYERHSVLLSTDNSLALQKLQLLQSVGDPNIIRAINVLQRKAKKIKDPVVDILNLIASRLSPGDNRLREVENLASYFESVDVYHHSLKLGDFLDMVSQAKVVIRGFTRKSIEERIGKNASQLTSEISALEREAGRPGYEGLLNSVFRNTDHVAIQKQKRSVRKGKEEQKSLEDVQKYFESGDVPELNHSIEDFQNYYGSEQNKINAGESLAEQLAGIREDVRRLDDERNDRRDGQLIRSDEDRANLTAQISEKKKIEAVIEGFQKKSKSLKDKAIKFLENYNKLSDRAAGGTKDAAMPALMQRIRLADPESSSFKLSDFNADIAALKVVSSALAKDDIVDRLDSDISDAEKAVKDAEKELKGLESAKEGNKNLTPEGFAQRVIAEILKRQDPSISPDLQFETAKAVLIDDIFTVQNNKDAEEMLQELEAGRQEVASEMAFKESLANFGYKQGDSVKRPFLKLRRENFESPEAIEALFERGVLDINTGFIALEALLHMNGGAPSEQTIALEKKLRGMVEDEIGATDKLPNAAVSKVVEKAMKKQKKKVAKMHEGYIANIRNSKVNLSEKRVEVWKKQLDLLNHKRRLKEIEPDVYEVKYQEIIDEAREYGLIHRLGRIHEDATLARYANSPLAGWFRDRGFGLKKTAEVKLDALSDEVQGAALKGAFWTAGLGLRTGWTILKHSGSLGLSLILGLFDKKKGLRATGKRIFSESVSGMGKFAADTTKSLVDQAKGSAKRLGDAKSDAKTDYKDRTEIKPDDIDSALKALEEELLGEPVEVGDKPFADFGKFKSQIKDLKPKKSKKNGKDD